MEQCFENIKVGDSVVFVQVVGIIYQPLPKSQG